MIAHFVNVLVPVNLHSKDDKAIEIAIHLADPRFCVIHLLDIVRPTILSSVFGRVPGQEMGGIGLHKFVRDMSQMSEMKQAIEQCRPNSTVKIHLCRSRNVSDAIAWYANRLCAQVVVIPEVESKKGFSLTDIAGRTHSKVLMYKDGLLSIVEKSDPLADDLPYGKVQQKVADVGVYFSVN